MDPYTIVFQRGKRILKSESKKTLTECTKAAKQNEPNADSFIIREEKFPSQPIIGTLKPNGHIDWVRGV